MQFYIYYKNNKGCIYFFTIYKCKLVRKNIKIIHSDIFVIQVSENEFNSISYGYLGRTVFI